MSKRNASQKGQSGFFFVFSSDPKSNHERSVPSYENNHDSASGRFNIGEEEARAIRKKLTQQLKEFGC